MCEDNEYYHSKRSIQFIEPLNDLTVECGCDAIFECKVEGYPPPKCLWFKDGKLIKQNKRISVYEQKSWHRLEIISVEFADHGLYNIVCKNNMNTIVAKANLYVVENTDDVLYTNIISNIYVIRHLSSVITKIGENIYLEATVKTDSDANYTWYKSGEIVYENSRTTIENSKNRPSLKISKGAFDDTGIYCVVARTKYGIVSSYACVQVFGDWNMKNNLIDHLNDTSITNRDDEGIFIQDPLPEELEANENEDVRLICVANIEFSTTIEWFKDKKKLNDYAIPEDYGHNYIGLRIRNPTKNDTGDYSVVIRDEKNGRYGSSSCFVTINASPIKYSLVTNLKRPLRSVVASYGTRVAFDCTYEVEDIKYLYVVWYVGRYRVERSNSAFSVVCRDGNFILYIKKVEPDMTGEVICELRRAYCNQKSITINRSSAYLTVVPQEIIKEEKTSLKYGKKKIFRDCADVEYDFDEILNLSILKRTTTNGHFSESQTNSIMEITYCKLEEDGVYFLYATRSDKCIYPVKLYIRNRHPNYVFFEWDYSSLPTSTWYQIEYCEDSNYITIGVSSISSLEIVCPPVEKMLMFRIRQIQPLDDCSEYNISIAPSSEPPDKPLKDHNLKPMELFDKEYDKTGDIIGCGAFGSVSLVKGAAGQYLAAKILKTRTQKKRDTALREYEMMKKLKHPKLVELIDSYVAKDMFVFVMDYLWGGELFDRIVEEEHIKEVDVVPYVRQICEALQYLHAHQIAHLDLKPENIICLNPNSGQVKIIDFGLARILVEGNITRAIYGTRDYVAPEVLNFESLTLACDLWSLGVVTYMLLSGVMPFAGESWPERSANIIMTNYNYNERAFSEISDLAKDFVDHLLVLEPGKRMTASLALQHKWIVEGPPKGMKAGPMKRARENLKSYLANYRARWQRAGNLMIAALRLRTHSNLNRVAHQTAAPCIT